MKNFLELELISWNETDLEAYQLIRENIESTVGLSPEDVIMESKLLDNKAQIVKIYLSYSDVNSVVAIIEDTPIRIQKKDTPLCTLRVEKVLGKNVLTNMYQNIVGTGLEVSQKIQKFLKENQE